MLRYHAQVLSILLFGLSSCASLFGDMKEKVSVELNEINGQALYEKKCSKCHGKNGKGDGRLAKLLKNIKDLSDPSMEKKNDQVLFDRITKGKSPMPSYRRSLSEQERWAVVKYIRSFTLKSETNGE